MAEFAPKVWLTAARIAYPNEKYIWDDEYGRPRLVDPKIPADAIVPFDPYAYGDDYRALREALDKEYGVVIYWNDINHRWRSIDTKRQDENSVEELIDDNITTLMLRNVQAPLKNVVVRFRALRKVGVVE